MPNFSPLPAPHNPLRTPKLHRLLASAALLALSLTSAHAQTLAHPGLVGNGLNADPWWQHAIFYKVSGPSPDPANPDPKSLDSRALTARLFTLRSLGIDALLLPIPDLPPQLQTASSEPSANPTLDAFDDLIHEASRDGIRILLTVPADTKVADLAGLARFWLARGVAGFQVANAPGIGLPETQTIIQAFRRVTSAAVGQRIVIGDFNPAAPGSAVAMPAPAAAPTPARAASRRAGPRRSATPPDPGTPQLQIDPRLNALALPEAANIRILLSQSVGANLLLDFHPPTPAPGAPDPYPALAKPVAAILLAGHPAALLEADRMPALPEPPAPESATPPSPAPIVPAEPGRTFTIVTAKPRVEAPKASAPDPLLDWYRQLATLHHDNAAIRYGTLQLLNFDDQNALVWVARPATSSPLTPPVIVACNLTSTPVQIALAPVLKTLDLRGSYLRTLLRSDKSMGPQDLNAVILPPFGVYIGELHR